MKLIQTIALGTLVAAGLVMAQVPATPPAASTAKTAAKDAKVKVVKPAPTAAEIADAKAKGLVWVNNNSKVFHKSDVESLYGKTKNGEFMTEADAIKGGNRAAKDQMSKGGKKGAKSDSKN